MHTLIYDKISTYTYIKENFSEEIAEIVYLVTPESGRTIEESNKKTYIKMKGNYKAIILKLAERLASIRYSKKDNLDLFNQYKKDQESLETYITLKGIILKQPRKGNVKYITNLTDTIINELYN